MKLSIILLACSLAGVLGGGALIGRWALGLCLIAVSVAVGCWALNRDDGTGEASVHAIHPVRTLQQVFDRSRSAA